MPRLSAAALGFVLLSLGVSACAQPPAAPTGVSPTPTFPPTAIKIENGGVATIAVPYLPTNFNPSYPTGANRVTQMVMEQVWPQSLVIDGASSVEQTGFIDSAELVSPSPETIQYKIDPGAVWSDGTPITVADFVYYWHEQLAYAGTLPFSGVLTGYQDIASITPLNGDKSFSVLFRQPYADWEGLFTNIVPATIAERIGWGGFTARNISDVVSGGPFAVSSYQPGKELVLVRNKRWWGTPAHLREIVFRVVTNAKRLWQGLHEGTIDVAEVGSSPATTTLAQEEGLSESTTLTPLLWQLCFNLASGPTANSYLRRAIASATDREQLVADTAGLDDPGLPVSENRIFPASAATADTTASPYGTVNLVSAQELMAKAGFVMGRDGYYEHRGDRASLTLVGPDGIPLVRSLEAEFTSQMAELGIFVTSHNVPLKRLLSTVLPSSSYEVALAPFVEPPYQSWTRPIYAGPPTSVALLGVVKSKARQTLAHDPTSDISSPIRPGGSSNGASWSPTFVAANVTGISDAAVTTLYTQAAAQLDLPTANGLYNEIDSLLWTVLPTLPLFQMPVTLITAHDLVNVDESPTWAGPMWNAQDWAIALNLPKSPPPMVLPG